MENNQNKANEDTYLNIKKNQNTNIDSTENNYKDNENEEDTYNKLIGVLNRKTSSYLYAKIGNTHTFFADKNASPLIVIGPNWIMYLSCCLIISLIFGFFFNAFWNYMNMLFRSIGLIIFFTFVTSYSYTSLINPGIPKYDENAILGKPRENYRFCRICCIWTKIEENTSHCFECNVCYEGFDHHCPWTGKCIAKNNTFSFYIFLISVLCSFCYFVSALTHAQHTMFLLNKKK